MSVIVHSRTDGIYSVEMGQRRVLAAREAGVRVSACAVATHDDRTAAVIRQLIESAHRTALGPEHEAEAHEQLAFNFGMFVTAIAEKTGTDRDSVKNGIAVATNYTARKAFTEIGIGLDQAAVLVEFEDDPAAPSASPTPPSPTRGTSITVTGCRAS